MNITDFLTNCEKQRVQSRIKIIKLLNQGSSIRQIAEELGVSTATVVKASKEFGDGKEKQAQKKKTKKAANKYFFG